MSLCLLASLIALFVCGVAESTLFDRNFYISVMTGETYIAGTHAYIESDIKNVCKIYNFPYEAIKPATSSELLKSLSADYASGLYNTMFSGTAPAAVTYPTSEFLKRIAVYCDILPGDDVFASDTTQLYLAGFFCEKADFALNSFTQKSITDPAYGLMSREFIASKTLPDLAAMLLFPLSEVSLLLFVLLLSGRKSRFRYRLYTASGTVWCASALIFIPCMLLSRYNLPARLPIAASPLKNFITAFLLQFIDFMFKVSLYSFAAASVLLIAAAIILVKRKKNAGSNK